MTTGETTDAQVDIQQGSHRAAVLRPRRLVGRDREIAEVMESVALTPLTTVTGPGGVGKTALALAVAAASEAQFSGGVFVVWLASLRSAEYIAPEVAARDCSNALVSYDLSKGPELENPLDPSSKRTGNTRYVLSEVYTSPSGIENHWRVSQESWSDFGAMVEMLSSCDTQTLHGGSIAESLW